MPDQITMIILREKQRDCFSFNDSESLDDSQNGGSSSESSDSCYVRQCLLSCDLFIKLSRESMSCILFIVVCTAIHNCSSLGSISSQHLGSI